ncbi:MAG: hypothetical protein GY820_00605 [Gammaproteobacteria bacterium]|nr:hypothetical protein [Gammaproteobacteria bacterium]
MNCFGPETTNYSVALYLEWFCKSFLAGPQISRAAGRGPLISHTRIRLIQKHAPGKHDPTPPAETRHTQHAHAMAVHATEATINSSTIPE